MTVAVASPALEGCLASSAGCGSYCATLRAGRAIVRPGYATFNEPKSGKEEVPSLQSPPISSTLDSPLTFPPPSSPPSPSSSSPPPPSSLFFSSARVHAPDEEQGVAAAAREGLRQVRRVFRRHRGGQSGNRPQGRDTIFPYYPLYIYYFNLLLFVLMRKRFSLATAESP